jgi:hypothetical protein
VNKNSAATNNPPAAADRSRAGAWHSRSWWTGVGGIATIITILIGIGAWWFPKSGPGPATPAPSGTGQGAAAGATEGSPAPIIATVVGSNDSGPTCGGRGFLRTSGLDQLTGAPEPPGELDGPQHMNDWFLAHGGTEVVNNVSITVEGPHTSAAILTAMKAVVDQRAPATGATVGYWECGGQLERRLFTADLAAPTPVVAGLVQNAPPGGTAPPPVSFPFTISTTDPEVFTVLLKRPRGDVKWHLELSWTLNGVSGTTRVPATGGFHSTDAPFYGVYPPSQFLKHPRSYSNGEWAT